MIIIQFSKLYELWDFLWGWVLHVSKIIAYFLSDAYELLI